MIKKALVYFFVGFFASGFCLVASHLARAVSGTVDSTYKFTWSENTGWFNYGTPEGSVAVGTTELTGYAWGENIGWISLNCSNTSSCGTVSYKVSNNGHGVLSGYAWAENVGWISFNCSNTLSCGTSNYSVTIDTTGSFSGYAWGENIGWVVFNCSTTSSCGTVDYKLQSSWVPPIPIVTAVTINGGNDITLTPNATTTVTVSFTLTDENGCSDVFTSGNVTSTLYRSGVGSSCSADNRNCYIVATTTNNCAAGTSANATSTFQLYYFAQATDASSSFSSQNWLATIFARDSDGNATSGVSSGVEVNTLTAINVTTSSINYGSVNANADTGGTNQLATTTNAGNSSTTIQLFASATLTSGSNSIPTSSQHYSTSTFTYAGTSTALSASAATVSGFFLTSPTSTTSVSGLTYWGLAVPGGTATGTYSGTNVFSSLFKP